MSQYHLVAPRDQGRLNCKSLCEMLTHWLDDPRRVMATVCLDPEEKALVERLLAMSDELRVTKRELACARKESAALSASVMRRSWPSEEREVL